MYDHRLKTLRWVLIGALALMLLPFLIGCQAHETERGRGDAPVGTINGEPATIIEMPDRFENIAFKCHGTNGIYATTREAPPVIVPNDPECEG